MRLLLPPLFALALVASPAIAQDGAALIQKNNCAMCHATTPNGMAPTFASVAEKYAGNANATAKLAGIIKNGAHGGGAISMPPTAVNDADAKIMANYILGLK